MEGSKMSKSFGNIIPLREAVKMFNVDPLRLSVMATAELLQDAEFNQTVAKSMRDKLERLFRFARKVTETSVKEEANTSLETIDRWMLSRLQEHVKNTTEAMEKLTVRKAIHSTLFELDQDRQWYERRTKDQKEARKVVIGSVFKEVLNSQIRMLSPVAPFICEEIWEMLNGEKFIALSSWPKPHAAKKDVHAEEAETSIKKLLEDTANIIKATGLKPKKTYFYTAAQWKWKTYLKILEKSVRENVQQHEIMSELMKNRDLKTKAKKVAKFISQIIEEINYMSTEKKQRKMQVKIFDEVQNIRKAKDFLEKELHTQIECCREDEEELYDPKKRAEQAKPYRPAIYIE
jgi:leucyl-tRNA synthetase